MIHGFLRVAAATPECTVGDCGANTASVLSLAREAAGLGVSLVVFPELCVTGYTCADLFSQELLSRVSLAAVRLIAEKTRDLPVTLVVGFPLSRGAARYNCAAVISRGAVLGVVPKTHLPNYGEFYELRHFTPAPAENGTIPPGILGPEAVPFGTKILFCDEKNPDIAFACEICEDLWVPNPPSTAHAQAGALLLANLSASNEIVGKAAYRRTLVTGQSGRAVAAYLYADAGSGESTQDMVFSGHNLIAENGAIVAESALFSSGLLVADVDVGKLLQERRRMNTYEGDSSSYARVSLPLVGTQDGLGAAELRVAEQRSTEQRATAGSPADPGAEARPAQPLYRAIDPLPFVPQASADLSKRCEDVLSIQAAGLAKRLSHTGIKSVVIGLSGGLDSTLALLVAVRAFDALKLDRAGILAITMPGFGTTRRTKSNALKLAETLGISTADISIHKAVKQHFEDIGQDPEKLDITYENSQARERTQILMDKANQTNALVIGTGDLSELALGWATYNGDHMSMYGVNSSIPKTLVRHLVRHCADDAARYAVTPCDVKSGEAKAKDPAKDLARVLVSILETPVSPELLPPEDGKISQKTEHIVGPYELHDFFLYYLTRWGFSPAKILFLAECAFAPSGNARTEFYGRAEILKWMRVFYRRFFAQQFKRSCLPDGPKAGSVTLSPRSDWRMPSDASAAIWLKELENIADEG
ncbi:MAG TPA: NAD(+) synthase [Treponemataceae bacterium]|nr:NAD(+) synthase [Treponemataceae bacterium]